MRLFAVRHISDKQAVGFFFTEDEDELRFQVDPISDTRWCEYREIEEDSAIGWDGPAPQLGVEKEDLDEHYIALRQELSFYYGFDQFIGRDCNEGWLPLEAPHGGPWVYFIQAGQHIKIGFTAGRPEARMANLAVASAEEMRLLLVLPALSVDDEKRLHKQFAGLRVRGEWFRAEGELLDFIQRRKEEL